VAEIIIFLFRENGTFVNHHFFESLSRKWQRSSFFYLIFIDFIEMAFLWYKNPAFKMKLGAL